MIIAYFSEEKKGDARETRTSQIEEKKVEKSSYKNEAMAQTAPMMAQPKATHKGGVMRKR